MTHLLKLAGALILLTFLFASCKKCETTVAQVSEDEAMWLVYEQGDTIEFVNEKQEPVRFGHVMLRADQVPAEGYSMASDCIERLDVRAYSIIEDTKRIYPGLATFFQKSHDKFDVVLLIDRVGDVTLDIMQPTFPTLEVNNTLYTNVFEIVKSDSTKATDLKRLLFNKDFGYISVEYYDGKKLVRKY